MRIRTFLFPALAVLGLHSAHAASLPARAPGLWQSTTTVTGPNGQPIPNATDVVTVSCVDPETDLKFFTSGQSECSSMNISGSGAAYTIKGVCTEQGKPIKIDETLTYASAQRVTLTARFNAPAGPEKLTSDLQWQGACLAGMSPGDEGDIVNGAFSKAGNINDPFNQ
ncbi:MAG: hypothetical protein B7X08_00980 [Acidocella sp. 20-63-7]|nr:MAG: hypothetical protein B7X08_00980 [Acidocella sp. 20-63-7]HQT45800.1 DUF3617 family protein [Acidocella sp.]